MTTRGTSDTAESDPAEKDEIAATDRDLRHRVEALALRWESVPRPKVGWDAQMSAAESGLRLGAWSILQDHAAELRKAICARRCNSCWCSWTAPIGTCPECGTMYEAAGAPTPEPADDTVAGTPPLGETYDALVAACHAEQRQAWDAGRGSETMTLEQHWSATAGWLRWREREQKRTGEPDWPDAMNSSEPHFGNPVSPPGIKHGGDGQDDT